MRSAPERPAPARLVPARPVPGHAPPRQAHHWQAGGAPASGSARVLAIAVVLLLAASLPQPVFAQAVRLLVQSSPLAGFRYHEAPALFPEMRVGDELTLVREPGNPHDAAAVRVEWRGRMLGYVPRARNDAVAWAMDRGEPMSARVSRLQAHRNPRLRVEFEIFVQ